MSIPGLSQFPDLEAQYQERLRQIRSKRGCHGCDIRKLNERYRQLLAKRLERDKGA
jgi:hypothetical protein